jgi:hypothetical protein
LKTEEELDVVLVALLLELINLFVIRDRGRAEIVVAIEQPAERILEAALGQARLADSSPLTFRFPWRRRSSSGTYLIIS